MQTPIQKFKDEYKYIQKYLIDNGQISMSVSVSNHYRKIFLLSCASLFEKQIKDILINFVDKNTGDARISYFLTNKAIERQYHTYFDWDKKNINKFLGLFGSEYKKKIELVIKQNQSLSEQIEAFLTIGFERNKMVHENFLEYQLNKTFEEICDLSEKASKFIQFIEESFMQE